MQDLIDKGVEFLRSLLKTLLIGEDTPPQQSNPNQKPSE